MLPVPTPWSKVATFSAMQWTPVGDGVAGGSSCGFLNALAIWLNKPHVVNRRLCGSCTLHSEVFSPGTAPRQCPAVLRRNAVKFASRAGLGASLRQLLDAAERDDKAALPEVEVQVRDLHPKLLDKFRTQREVVLIDRCALEAVFVPVLLVGQDGSTSPCQQPAYRITFQRNLVNIFIENFRPNEIQTSEELVSVPSNFQDTDTPIIATPLASTASLPRVSSGADCTATWLRDHLLRKVASWSRHDDLNTAVTSLKLVALDRYNSRYNGMKSRYGPRLVREWPESTDPQKFVYEDISIAAYLLTLWEAEREELGLTTPQSFVDLGCGNGLLVHLLSEEGHPGKGIDLRKRNIWTHFYGPKTHLEELTITPSDQSLFAGYDWLLGNHSDELTPWIPVIAARSSYTCRFFVLPCCSFDFDAKFAVKDHGRSQYRCYLDFVRGVGETCGFNVREDTLRIPSTKRICFVGESRTYPSSEEAHIDAQITDLIASRCSGTPTIAAPGGHDHGREGPGDGGCGGGDGPCGGGGAWAGTFRARPGEERPRNCVSLDKRLIAHVTDRVFAAVMAAGRDASRTTADDRKWRTGGPVALGEVVAMFEPSMMKELKNECGGLQTLLRNQYHVFRVQAGCVHIRDMGAEDELHWDRKRKQKGNRKCSSDMRKTRLCYLHQHHPDGCPQTAELCRFAHGEEELKPKMQPRDVDRDS